MKVSYKEACDVFPKEDVIKIHDGLIDELQIKLSGLAENLRDLKLRSTTCPDKEDFVYDIAIENREKEIEEVKKSIKKYQRRNDILKGTVKARESYDLDAIKTVPIGDLIPYQPASQFGRRKKYLCPFHEEKTPSFVVYEDDNSCHCFGCGYSGDVIQVYMDYNKCSFLEACKHLSSMA